MTTTATSGTVWQLDADEMDDADFADGLRLSTDCVARRLIEPLDPDRYHEFPEHLSKRGHGFEWVLQRWLRRQFGVEGVREVHVPWEYGESHLDLFLEQPAPAWETRNGVPLQVEVKANKGASVKTENVRQVQRQMFAVERAIATGRVIRVPVPVMSGGELVRDENGKGQWTWRDVDPELYADAEWRIVVIDPATWRIPNPQGVRVLVSDERRAELEAEWEVMQWFMGLPVRAQRWAIEEDRLLSQCRCGKCDPIKVLEELPRNMVENAQAYLHALSEEKDAATEKKWHGDVLKKGLSVAKVRMPEVFEEHGGSFVGGGVKVTVDKRGAIRVTESEAKPAPLL